MKAYTIIAREGEVGVELLVEAWEGEKITVSFADPRVRWQNDNSWKKTISIVRIEDEEVKNFGGVDV